MNGSVIMSKIVWLDDFGSASMKIRFRVPCWLPLITQHKEKTRTGTYSTDHCNEKRLYQINYTN